MVHSSVDDDINVNVYLNSHAYSYLVLGRNNTFHLIELFRTLTGEKVVIWEGDSFFQIQRVRTCEASSSSSNWMDNSATLRLKMAILKE
jgi:hypothetical protein